jgi:UDP-glucose 4-epimerase
MRIGITGSSGFVGSHLTCALSREIAGLSAEPIRLLVRHSNPGATYHPGLEICAGDLTSKNDCEKFVADLDVVYHLAHQNSPVNSDRDVAADTLQNLIPTQNLLEAMSRQSRAIHCVYFSSGGAVYNAPGRRTPFRETDATCPTSSYGVQKIAAEHYLRLAAERGAISATVLRIGNAFGGLLPQHRMQGFVGVAAAAALAGRPIRVFGDPGNVRDWVHLSDIATMAWIARQPRQPYDIVNVGNGLGHSVENILSILRDASRVPITVEHVPSVGANLVDWIVLDVSKAKSDYGWEPTLSLTDGIRHLLAEAR